MQAWIMFLILVSALKFDKQEKAMHGILVIVRYQEYLHNYT